MSASGKLNKVEVHCSGFLDLWTSGKGDFYNGGFRNRRSVGGGGSKDRPHRLSPRV